MTGELADGLRSSGWKQRGQKEMRSHADVSKAIFHLIFTMGILNFELMNFKHDILR